ncbi:MAG TPA: hypothetical protein VHG28_21660 [Longimicrobiaceae bacterium]|nr:hypothetical protein [Longimicrobiaceae bacterium]
MLVYAVLWGVLWLGVLAWGLRPVTYDRERLATVAEQTFGPDLEAYWQKARTQRNFAPVTLKLNPFVLLRATINTRQAVPSGEQPAGDVRTRRMEYETLVRWDSLIIFTLGLATLAFVLWPLYARESTSRLLPFPEAPLAEPPPVPVNPQPAPSAPSLEQQILLGDVRNALRRANDLDRYSKYLLVAGLAVAVFGPILFSMYAPLPMPEDTTVLYLGKLFRPLGILLFIEGIAWFLLRQYRALSEDYKYYYRSYLKRSNYLVALRLIGESDDEAARALKTLLLTALAHDESPEGRSPGDTAAAIEAARAVEAPPLNALVRAIVERLPGPEKK